MYWINLFIAMFLYPIISYFFIPKIEKRKAIIILLCCLLAGSVFAYFSTFHGYSFEFNFLDIITINIFLLSIFSIVAWLFFQQIKKSKWLPILSLIFCSLLVFFIFNNAFGPSESVGQRFPEQTMHIDEEHTITHAGYQYGYMDYGSRFLVYKHSFGIEKIIGIAENANDYYGDDFKLQANLDKQIIIIDYIDYQRDQKKDTLYIQLPE